MICKISFMLKSLFIYYKTSSDTDNTWKRFLCQCVRSTYFIDAEYLLPQLEKEIQYFVGFEETLSGWVVFESRLESKLISIELTNRVKVFLAHVDKKREHLLVMLNVFYRGVKNYFVLIWTNFEWVRCFWVCIIDSIAVCALFLWQVWWAHKNGRGPNRIGLCHR